MKNRALKPQYVVALEQEIDKNVKIISYKTEKNILLS